MTPVEDPMMASAIAPEAYVRRAADAYAARLRDELDEHGTTPGIDPEIAGAQAAAHTAAGLTWNAEIGPFYDTNGARVALGSVTRQAVSDRVRQGRLLGLRLAPDGSGRDRSIFPRWQFQPAVLRTLPDVLATAGFDPDRPTTGWTIAAWLTTADDRLGDLTPLQLLEAGHRRRVLEIANDVADSLGSAERAAEHALPAAG